MAQITVEAIGQIDPFKKQHGTADRVRSGGEFDTPAKIPGGNGHGVRAQRIGIFIGCRGTQLLQPARKKMQAFARLRQRPKLNPIRGRQRTQAAFPLRIPTQAAQEFVLHRCLM